ncbi:MAG: hypothetical protein ACRDOI_29740 [Trebonia sp.]
MASGENHGTTASTPARTAVATRAASASSAVLFESSDPPPAGSAVAWPAGTGSLSS